MVQRLCPCVFSWRCKQISRRKISVSSIVGVVVFFKIENFLFSIFFKAGCFDWKDEAKLSNSSLSGSESLSSMKPPQKDLGVNSMELVRLKFFEGVTEKSFNEL